MGQHPITQKKNTHSKKNPWYGHVQRMAEERVRKIALKWMSKQDSTRKTEEKLDGRYKEGHE
jgi:hypothetical protein